MQNCLKYIIPAVVLLASLQGSAQCAMCRAALETSDAGIKPEGVNNGIVYLMIFPYLLIGLVGYAVYRLRKKSKEKEARS
jgi:uncharacterized membrane protein